MCRAVACKTCQKTTWAGCGQHVKEVMRNIPDPQRCPGHADEAPARQGLFSTLFSRNRSG